MLIFIIPCPQAPNNSIWMQSCHALIYDIVLQYTNDVLWCMMIFWCTGMVVQNQCEEMRLSSCFSLCSIMGHKPHLHRNFIQLNLISIWQMKLQKRRSTNQLCLGKSCPYMNIYAYLCLPIIWRVKHWASTTFCAAGNGHVYWGKMHWPEYPGAVNKFNTT